MDEKPKVTVEPFRGTVNVMFSDAIIASTREALVVREEDREPVFYIPFRDVYFDFLRESATERHAPLKGSARYWNAWAVGESADDVMWAYDQPSPELRAIRQHAAFDPGKVRIEAVPQQDIIHEPHVP
ncbi:DUF427 domain-containing protein [Chelativorans sp. AA-79]|uniref:DUF427 domain-containing protein n=1 Tax=Chelativorans sp. AA-79 TaxID=3028735 RepID=UPI0023F9258D|nr:DUF427 domain-containing protein [Chelativorans sp. AA-79]WEX10231.1 DUF427 domain-containing protein [Chelativorans sp. AA-79]